jgi:hypothetical protein
VPHRRLFPGRPIPEHIGPYVDPFDKIQDAFGDKNYLRNPIDSEFLAHFVAQLKLIFPNVTRDGSYSTRDGRVWTAINFLYDGHWYKLLLPRHEGKTNTGLVSLYCKRDPGLYEDAIDAEINEVGQAIVSRFLTARSEFYADKRR